RLLLLETSPLLSYCASELQIRECLDAQARQQNLVLVVRHAVANILVEKIVADHADGELLEAEIGGLELRRIADLGLEQIVSWSRRLADHRNVVLRKRVQEVDPRDPVRVA